ncbi:MAG: DUF423 domain-containing protein [Pseudomonadota bacterium]|nr:DUF423 domain-containing protein [Pseudomonadota bacterium]
MVLIFGATLGLASVFFGAFVEHGLNENITSYQIDALETAIRYNQVNAVLISAVGLALLNGGKLARICIIRWSATFLIIGTILFCFGIYLAVFLESPNLSKITPIGGLAIIVAWVLLLIGGIVGRRP